MLCYVSEPWAYFTTADIFDQWGDDWNDAPYEHNAGDPYEWHPYMAERGVEAYTLFKVAFDGPWETPSSYELNSAYSVEDINHGKVAWLHTDRYSLHSVEKPVCIMAGTPLIEFCKLVAEGGGHTYARAL